MSPATTIRYPRRTDPVVARVVRAWRELTGGGRDDHADRRTLLAVSGGVDSGAMAIALAASSRSLVVAHVRHDLRPPAQADADAEHARALAEALDLPFVRAEVAVAEAPGNTAAAARRARYEALAQAARTHACPYVATAHHADDQLESVLLALVRGAGPDGLRGLARSRRLADDVRLIRPMLETTRAEARALCRQAGWAWREDQSNLDTSRLRNALRHGPIAQLTELRPAAPTAAHRTTRLMRDAAGLITDHARSLLDRAETTPDADGRPVRYEWPRSALEAERRIVLGQMFRIATSELAGGEGMDSLPMRSLDQLVEAVREQGAPPREFVFKHVRVRSNARTLTIERKDHA